MYPLATAKVPPGVQRYKPSDWDQTARQHIGSNSNMVVSEIMRQCGSEDVVAWHNGMKSGRQSF